MLHEMGGDLFQSLCETLVCPVNTKGVMGAGLAKVFARRFPGLEQSYRDACQWGTIRVGRPGIFFFPHLTRAVIALPTKADWRDPSEIAYVEAGLAALVDNVQSHRWTIDMLAVPALGCGLGGLDWADVRPVMEHYLGMLAMPVEIYPPKEFVRRVQTI